MLVFSIPRSEPSTFKISDRIAAIRVVEEQPDAMLRVCGMFNGCV